MFLKIVSWPPFLAVCVVEMLQTPFFFGLFVLQAAGTKREGNTAIMDDTCLASSKKMLQIVFSTVKTV